MTSHEDYCRPFLNMAVLYGSLLTFLMPLHLIPVLPGIDDVINKNSNGVRLRRMRRVTQVIHLFMCSFKLSKRKNFSSIPLSLVLKSLWIKLTKGRLSRERAKFIYVLTRKDTHRKYSSKKLFELRTYIPSQQREWVRISWNNKWWKVTEKYMGEINGR